MSGMIGDTRVNRYEGAMSGWDGMFGGMMSMVNDPRPKVMDTKEELLMAILDKLNNLKPTITIGYNDDTNSI